MLEVAVGTGQNLPHYPRGCTITAIDLSPEMLSVARKRADRLNLDVIFRVMDAEALDFADSSFDTVVSSLSTCTFPDPIKALQEMARVCRPGGKVLLLEHGRSSHPRLARFQDRRAEGFAKPLGCRWNREPLELVGQAGFTTVTASRTFFGVLHAIKATTPKRQQCLPLKPDADDGIRQLTPYETTRASRAKGSDTGSIVLARQRVLRGAARGRLG